MVKLPTTQFVICQITGIQIAAIMLLVLQIVEMKPLSVQLCNVVMTETVNHKVTMTLCVKNNTAVSQEPVLKNNGAHQLTA